MQLFYLLPLNFPDSRVQFEMLFPYDLIKISNCLFSLCATNLLELITERRNDPVHLRPYFSQHIVRRINSRFYNGFLQFLIACRARVRQLDLLQF